MTHMTLALKTVSIRIWEDCTGHWLAAYGDTIIAHAYGRSKDNILQAAQEYFDKRLKKPAP